MFQFLTHVELSKSMAAILEMPHYMAYQKIVAHIYQYYCGKSPAFNKMCTNSLKTMVLAALLYQRSFNIWQLHTTLFSTHHLKKLPIFGRSLRVGKTTVKAESVLQEIWKWNDYRIQVSHTPLDTLKWEKLPYKVIYQLES